MQRSAMFSCLLNMDGYGQVDSELGGVIVTDILAWWDKMPKDLQQRMFGSDMYRWAQKYAELVELYFGDRTFLPMSNPANRFNLSVSTQRWEAWACVLKLENERKSLIHDALNERLVPAQRVWVG